MLGLKDSGCGVRRSRWAVGEQYGLEGVSSHRRVEKIQDIVERLDKWTEAPYSRSWIISLTNSNIQVLIRTMYSGRLDLEETADYPTPVESCVSCVQINYIACGD